MSFIVASQKVKIFDKLFLILFDFVNTADSILTKHDPRVVFGKDADLITALLKHIKDADMADVEGFAFRCNIL